MRHVFDALVRDREEKLVAGWSIVREGILRSGGKGLRFGWRKGSPLKDLGYDEWTGHDFGLIDHTYRYTDSRGCPEESMSGLVVREQMSDQMTCNGACCSVFDLRLGGETSSLEELRVRLAAGERIQDGDFIADMLVPLDRDSAQAVRAHEGLSLIGGDDIAPRYTCRHWDLATRLCTVYDRRPTMCRRYGTVEDPCSHGCGCGV